MCASPDRDRAVATALGFIDRSDRGRLSVSGTDRAKFLHNVTTNDVKRLAEGRGVEAFVTSLQGKTLAFVTLLACDDRILLRTETQALEAVLPHLRKYGLFDEVVLEVESPRTFEFHLAGPAAEPLLLQAGAALPGDHDLAHRAIALAGRRVRVVREAPTGRPGLSILGSRDDAGTVSAWLCDRGEALGLVRLSSEDFEVLRIEGGTPLSGRDVTDENLPQEVGRDARAISFVKGCYLGQETVARIDALGHVNKVLKGIRLPEGATTPPPGTPLEDAGKRVGGITSSAFSTGWGASLALAYVRTSHARPETPVHISLPQGAVLAVVVDLPMLPPHSTAR